MAEDDGEDYSKVHHADAVNLEPIETAQTDDKQGKDVTLSHPVEDISELERTSHLQKELRDANIDRNFDEEQIDQLFNHGILDKADNALAAHGVDVNSETLPVGTDYIRLFLLAKARGQYISKFHIYLKDQPDLLDRLDLSSGYSSSKLYNVRAEVEKNGTTLESIEEASVEALFAVFREGKPVPDDVRKRHEDGLCDTPEITPYSSSYDWESDAVDISPELRSETIENWAAFFFDECLESIHLGRGENISHDMDAVLGLFAHASAQSTTLRDARKTAECWDADPEVVPANDTITKPIKQLSLTEIKEMFIEANINTIQIAKEHNLIDKSTKMAFDPTDELYFGENPAVDKWIKGHADQLKGEVNPSYADKWEFGLLSTIGSMRFSLGVYPIGGKVSQANSLETIFREIYDKYSIVTDYITMDKGLSGAAMLEAIRNSSDLDIIMPVNTRNNESIKDVRDDLDDDQDKFDTDPDIFTDLKNKPNLYYHPISDDELDSTRSHRLFITDYEQNRIERNEAGEAADGGADDSDDSAERINLNDEYRNRARIEKTLEQVKNDFMAETQSNNTKVRFFYFNIAMVFQNLHTLINNGVSPDRRVRLAVDENDVVSANEVLTGFKEMAFRRAEQEES